MSGLGAKDPRNLSGINRILITDVGSTTTKAILFDKENGHWRFFREEAPTTVEKPHQDVAVGVLNAIKALERETGYRLLQDGVPSLPYLSTSSAGGGLAMAVTGLVRELSAQSADWVALGAGAIVLDVIAMNDGRTPYGKIEALKKLRPDMLLLAGGFDADNISGPVFLAELVAEADLHPKLNPEARLDIIFGGNANACEYVAQVLKERYQFHPVPNVRPSGGHENPEPARRVIHELFMDHVMSQAPGFHRIKPWVASPVRPTPAAVGAILALVSKDTGKTIMAIDLGGATTDVFTALGGRVFRTVSANLGMSYSIRNVVEQAGTASIRKLHRLDLGDRQLWNRIGNKHINPTGLPGSHQDMLVEWAVATVAIREAVVQHLEVMRGAPEEAAPLRPDIDVLIRGSRPKWREGLRPEGRPVVALEDYDMIMGSGGILSHSPREAAAMMMVDALQPIGVVELAVDRAFMLPHLGVLAELDPELAKELFYGLALVRLGSLFAPAGGDGARMVRISGATSKGRSVDRAVPAEEVELIPLAEDEDLKITWQTEQGQRDLRLHGGACGLLVDNRRRPIAAGAGCLLTEKYVPGAPEIQVRPEDRIWKGTLMLRRELAIPGEILVRPGDQVETDTLVARSQRQFLRPFFIDVAGPLGVPPQEVGQYLVKNVGQEIGLDDVIARRPRKVLSLKVLRSNVRARIEKMLPNGTLVARELPELAYQYVTVNVAQDLGRPPWQIKPYLRVGVGQTVERGQWLAAQVGPGGVRHSASPVRGKVDRIDLHFGMVVIQPLLEELEIRAWLPGRVTELTDRGAVIEGKGTRTHGVWGMGGETAGKLVLGELQSGAVVVRHYAEPGLLSRLGQVGAAGLVTGGLDLRDMLGAEPEFSIVVTEGFGKQEIAPELYSLLRTSEGRLVLVDGTTQLRVGVRRPLLIVPGP